MALSNENDMVMPVTPMCNYGNGGFGNSFGGDWAWIILLLLLAGNGGWGNGFGGFGTLPNPGGRVPQPAAHGGFVFDDDMYGGYEEQGGYNGF